MMIIMDTKQNYEIDVQLIDDSYFIPHEPLLIDWLMLALNTRAKGCQISLRVVDKNEIHALNLQYRGKDKATNVLSFPYQLPPQFNTEHYVYGDIIICAEIVNQEASEQGKSKPAHWAHMIIHGCLHLLGYDHIKHEDAIIMEPLEIQLLQSLGYKNPYEACNE
jgi:probable rRNA maturation factor